MRARCCRLRPQQGRGPARESGVQLSASVPHPPLIRPEAWRRAVGPHAGRCSTYRWRLLQARFRPPVELGQRSGAAVVWDPCKAKRTGPPVHTPNTTMLVDALAIWIDQGARMARLQWCGMRSRRAGGGSEGAKTHHCTELPTALTHTPCYHAAACFRGDTHNLRRSSVPAGR